MWFRSLPSLDEQSIRGSRAQLWAEHLEGDELCRLPVESSTVYYPPLRHGRPPRRQRGVA